ncbi:hypothetical protein [Janthinobacterium sp. GW458P]|uniref:hypothetical protein n=1 Tax=Janthinobacterium sp. GW458P TaxID=1981504 RepID=UPI0015521DA0|nr:hypothetical protein [Janthinobacterium sp. GW458P]MBE3024579.1 hypothetical protein [Janthinobacterium sp. GW458P]
MSAPDNTFSLIEKQQSHAPACAEPGLAPMRTHVTMCEFFLLAICYPAARNHEPPGHDATLSQCVWLFMKISNEQSIEGSACILSLPYSLSQVLPCSFSASGKTIENCLPSQLVCGWSAAHGMNFLKALSMA